MTTQYTVSSISTFCQYANQYFRNPDDVSVIFDVGSLHCLESIEFSKKYKNARIFAFEANPDSYRVCLENTKDIDNITVINQAVNDYTLAGVDSVQAPMERRHQAWQLLAQQVRWEALNSMVHEVALSQAPEVAQRLMRGEHSGRTVVDVNR